MSSIIGSKFVIYIAIIASSLLIISSAVAAHSNPITGYGIHNGPYTTGRAIAE